MNDISKKKFQVINNIVGLGTYMRVSGMSITPSETQSSDSTKQYLKLISEQKKNLSSISRYLKNYSKREPSSLESVRQLQAILKNLVQRAQSLEDGAIRQSLENWIIEETHGLKLIASRLRTSFAEKLYTLLRDEGLRLEGHLPSLKTSFYILEVDFERNICKIFYGQDKEPVVNLKINSQEVTQYIVSHRKKLDTSFEDLDMFLTHLEKAYSTILKQTENKFGKKARIIDTMIELAVLKQNRAFMIDPLKKNFQNYGRVQFSYDLYRLMRDPSQSMRLKLYTATRGQARNRRDYLWVPKNERGEGTIYSYIELLEG